MSKQTRSDRLPSIDLHTLDTVTGGIGSGPGPAHRHRPAPANPWAALVPSASPGASDPWSGLAPRTAPGQAGTAGTPGAWVHNGKFRPL